MKSVVTPLHGLRHSNREAVFERRRFAPGDGSDNRPRVVPIALGIIPDEEAIAIVVSHSSPEPRFRGRRAVRRIAISALAPLLLLGCVGPEPGSNVAAATYRCENGTFFSVEFLGRRARVTTLKNSYLLERRPSLMGRKYSAGDVFFTQDEDRGILVGAADGPYRQCAAP